MPHLKFSRDKKGYEHTSLVRPGRKGGREGRILYWFRTPPHVKVGRSALDEEAIRLIEQYHPDITFDWPRILKTQPVIVEEPRPSKPEREVKKKKQARRTGPSAPADLRRETRGEAARAVRADQDADFGAAGSSPHDDTERDFGATGQAPQIEDLKEPTMIEAAVQENGETEWEAPVEAEPLVRSSEEGEGAFMSPRPMEALVGAEGLERLRARHAALLAAISEGIQDAAKREFLRHEAERLDPDSWVTIDAARTALETYESDYETIRRQLPARRRRRRRGRRSKNRQPAPHGHRAEHAEDHNGSGGDPDERGDPDGRGDPDERGDPDRRRDPDERGDPDGRGDPDERGDSDEREP